MSPIGLPFFEKAFDVEGDAAEFGRFSRSAFRQARLAAARRMDRNKKLAMLSTLSMVFEIADPAAAHWESAPFRDGTRLTPAPS